jgi:glycerophosphoryl diester phosphodiesterase
MGRGREVAGRVRTRWRAVLAVSAVVSLAQALVLAPVGAFLLRVFLSHAGKASIGNFEIARFLLSPIGVASLLVLGTIALGGAYLHVAALLRVLGDPAETAGTALLRLVKDAQRLLRLGALEVGAALLVAVPLVAASAALVARLWAGRDLNGLLVLKPPEFWWGAAAGALPLLLLAGLLAYGALRWLFALPIVLEEPWRLPVAAMRASAERTRGRRLAHLRALAGWAVVAVALGAVAPALVAVPGAWLLARVGPGTGAALPATAAVLALWAAVGTAATWTSLALLAGLVDRLHREAAGRPPASSVPGAGTASRPRLRAGVALLAGFAILAAVAAWLLLRTQALPERVEITAHRMGAHRGPENTVAALRRAMADGAEWAELDVQLTSDGALVVLHDFDLVRIGGPAKRVAEATLEEVRAIDVGTALGFERDAGERVPTLDEVVAAAGSAIRLNIELKPPTAASVPALTDAVLDVVRRTGLVGRCRLCSQSYEAMRRAKEAEPGLEVGFIAGAALGDLARLDVDFLMVSGRLATARLVGEAHARGLEVHPWTVNDPDDLAPLLDRGVDNVITDAPAAMRARLDALRALTPPERLLLRVRNRLTE